MSNLPNGRIARMDKQRPTISRPNTPKISGGKRLGTGIGHRTMQAIRSASGETACGNCGNSYDLTYSDRCEQLLCGECRKLYVRAIRRIPFEAKLDRRLGLAGKVVPGTLFPRSE